MKQKRSGIDYKDQFETLKIEMS